MLVLISQTFWALNAYEQNKKDIKTRARLALDITSKKATNHSTCFETFSKAYIKKGESFYLSKFNKNKLIDTVPMFYNGRGIYYNESDKKFLEKYNKFNFKIPVTAEVVINFRYQFNDTNFSKISQDSVFKRLNPTNYQEVFSGNINITNLYETKYIDSTLNVELAKQDLHFPFSYGIIESSINKVVYKNQTIADSLLINSEYKSNLNEEGYFNKHYALVIVFRTKLIVGKNLWRMLAISAFVVLLLILLLWQFIRVIIRQRKISEMKNDFINNMTHEFNTPIANISLAAESLTKNVHLQKDEKTFKLISIIHEQNESIRANVERILKIAANDKGIMQLNKERLNLNELIKSVIYEFEMLVVEKGGKIHFDEKQESVYINVDELQVLHMIQNIIDNAIKYNSNKPFITITLSDTGSFTKISFEDNGIGMTKEEIKYIFDKFYRVPTGNIHHAKGFGLGLNYVQSILYAHNGTINVKSKPGKGSVFDVYLPKEN